MASSHKTILIAPSPPPASRSRTGSARRSEQSAGPDDRLPPAVPGSSSPLNDFACRDNSQARQVSGSSLLLEESLPRSCDVVEVDRPYEREGGCSRGGTEDAERDELESENDEDDNSEDDKFSLHVEVRLQPNSTILYDTVRRAVGKHITDNFTSLETHAPVPSWREVKLLVNEVENIYCAESGYPHPLAPLNAVHLHIHVYELPAEGSDKILPLCVSLQDSADSSGDAEIGDDKPGEDGDVAAFRLGLPANRLEGVWESLIYEEGLKTKLLNYIYSSIIFAEKNVNSALISWHRLVLLHGPPGTGKTSLCRALAQKVSVRLSEMYHRTELVEINSHSLFSKWFSESGKLVDSLFTKIEHMTEDPDVFVMVLIDEVESLAGSRSSGTTGGEPSDAMRAVNALLTALDKLRHCRNVLVLTTSNLTDSIDNAFLDRADIRQYIGLPTTEAVYWILRTCLIELGKVGILRSRELIDYKEAIMVRDGLSDTVRWGIGPSKISGVGKDARKISAERSRNSAIKLLELAECATGMSGRALRRLPLLAHARTSASRSLAKKLDIEPFLTVMILVVKEEKGSIAKMVL